jgi:hypothetical protein
MVINFKNNQELVLAKHLILVNGGSIILVAWIMEVCKP